MTAVGPSPAGPRARLPLWRSVREAYGLTIWHLGAFCRIAWPWLAFLVAPAELLLAWSEYGTFPESAATLVTGVSFVASLFATAAIATRWHRFLLQHPGPPTLVRTLHYAVLDMAISSTLLVGHLLLMLAFLLISGLAMLILPNLGGMELGGMEVVLGLCLAAVAAAAIVLMSRLAISLPAVALAHPTPLASASRLAGRSWLRILVGSWLTIGPALFLLGAWAFRMAHNDDISALGIGERLGLAAATCSINLLWWTFLTIAYRRLLAPDAPDSVMGDQGD